MAAYPAGRDGPLEKKRKKVVVWSEEEEEMMPDPSAWIYPDSFGYGYLAKMEQAGGDEESAPRPVKMPTLDYFKPRTRFHTTELFSVREYGSQAMLSAAKFLLGVSFSLDGGPLGRCSGFWVDWMRRRKPALFWTTARLIRTKDAPFSVWSGSEGYAPHADVQVEYEWRCRFHILRCLDDDLSRCEHIDRLGRSRRCEMGSHVRTRPAHAEHGDVPAGRASSPAGGAAAGPARRRRADGGCTFAA